MSDNISEFVKRLRGWATDARLGRVMIGADLDIREAADALEAQYNLTIKHAELLNKMLGESEAEVERLRAALLRTAASLAAAISLLERGGKATKKAAPSDKMFDQMLIDYNRALDNARKALEEK